MEQEQLLVTPTAEDLRQPGLPRAGEHSTGSTSARESGGPADTPAHDLRFLRPLDHLESTSTGDRLAPLSASPAAPLQMETRQRRWREAADGLERITIDPSVLGGIPVVRDTRISVAQLLDMLSDVDSLCSLLQEFPNRLDVDDLHEAVAFAARLAR